MDKLNQPDQKKFYIQDLYVEASTQFIERTKKKLNLN